MGLTIEEASGPGVEVWDENWPSINVFICMSTQWLVNAGGPYGLNYVALAEVWQRTKTPEESRDAIFEDLRLMEGVALEVMRQQNDK